MFLCSKTLDLEIKMEVKMQMQENEIVLYQPNDTIHLEVRMADETVWLTQAQLVELYQSSKANISEHIRHIFEEGELDENSTVRKFRTVQIEGDRQVAREQTFYNLDMIISLGYRVKSMIATRFRRWATSVLKEYLLKGYAVNQRFERLEQRVSRTEEKIEFFVRTSLPPVEGVFFDGQIYDAYELASRLVKSARSRIILIDNYIDETVLTLLDKREAGVAAEVYTHQPNTQLKLDIERHNRQYAPIPVHVLTRSHDRFLCIDDTVYHIGASLKDLGKKWFAFSCMEIKTETLTANLPKDDFVPQEPF